MTAWVWDEGSSPGGLSALSGLDSGIRARVRDQGLSPGSGLQSGIRASVLDGADPGVSSSLAAELRRCGFKSWPGRGSIYCPWDKRWCHIHPEWRVSSSSSHIFQTDARTNIHHSPADLELNMGEWQHVITCRYSCHFILMCISINSLCQFLCRKCMNVLFIIVFSRAKLPSCLMVLLVFWYIHFFNWSLIISINQPVMGLID